MTNKVINNLQFDAVLFDLDGVIIKSMEQHLEAWHYAFSEFGADITARDFYELEGRGVRLVAEILAEKYNIPRDETPKIARLKNAYYDKIVKIEYYEGLFPLLRYLKAKNKKLAIITGSLRSRVRKLTDGRLNGYFSAYVTSEDVMQTKPFPEPFLKGAELLNVAPQNCLVIENAPLGITAAKRAGMMVFAVASTVSAGKLAEADHVFPSLMEIHKKLLEIL